MTVDFTDLLCDIENKPIVFHTAPRSEAIRSYLQESRKISQAQLLIVGSGAIGCELLKNISQCGIASSPEGRVYLTDPDFIEASNLNRQFLFRERHVRMPKSMVAAASIKLNNLSINLMPFTEFLGPDTESIFTKQFWSRLDCVANALDNVKARTYVDSRCVDSLVPLIESGTLGTKGHVQTIVPFYTESYTAVEENEATGSAEIPYCTLKLFPEKSEHCIEWARDKFESIFRLDVEAAQKTLEIFGEILSTKSQPNEIAEELIKVSNF